VESQPGRGSRFVLRLPDATKSMAVGGHSTCPGVLSPAQA
jgi:hypothetical protein